MTITIDLPEEVAAALAEEARQQGRSTTELIAQEVLARFQKAASRTTRRSVMEFRGIGKGRPGAIVGDMDTYIESMRDEWKERDRSWRRQ